MVESFLIQRFHCQQKSICRTLGAVEDKHYKYFQSLRLKKRVSNEHLASPEPSFFMKRLDKTRARRQVITLAQQRTNRGVDTVFSAGQQAGSTLCRVPTKSCVW